MDKVNYNKSEQEAKPQADDQSVMFRWILLILMSVAAKVLNKTEVMNIYTLVGQTIGHSQIVDGLHSELIGMMKYKKVHWFDKYIRKNKNQHYEVWDELVTEVVAVYDSYDEARRMIKLNKKNYKGD